MSEVREHWTEDGAHWAVIDYDQRGCATVTREVMHDLLRKAGFNQATPPPHVENWWCSACALWELRAEAREQEASA